jgi:hypothetical protein
MGLMSDVLGTHGHAHGPRATGHVAAPEPSRTRRRDWSHMTRGGTGALLGSGPGASVTWQHQSLPTQGWAWSHVTEAPGALLGGGPGALVTWRR